MKRLIFVILLFFSLSSLAQKIHLTGLIVDTKDQPIEGVNIVILQTGQGGSTDSRGHFDILINRLDSITIKVTHLSYLSFQKTFLLHEFFNNSIKIILNENQQVLEQVIIQEGNTINIRNEASSFNINPIDSRSLPSASQDISSILATLPGVIGNNELSNAYNVRGGNFDENLVYVNNMPVYRPFLIRAGQQEGLSFVNTDLVDNIDFSSGGWQAKYGDGLSSVLNIHYKKPVQFSGSATLGLLGGSAHLEGASKDRKFNFILGARNKRSEYLLNTLETKGEYKPSFSDFQGFFNLDLTKDPKSSRKTELGILLSYARNRYLVEPENRETTFGTFNEQLRLYVAFDGRERTQYDTYQGGISLHHWFNDHFKSTLIISQTFTQEREYFDVEAGYLLCNIDLNPGSSTFDKCLTNIGIGTQYRSGRNRLDASISNIENRNSIDINPKLTIEYGAGYTFQTVEDHVSEYSFTDSSDYVTVDEAVKADNNLQTNRLQGYVQFNYKIADNQWFNAGARLFYMDLNRQFLISPRMQYSIKPRWRQDVVLRFAAGLYQQPPFYRELRDFDGHLNKSLKAQSSVHAITGLDWNFIKWGRPFKFTTEAYYKYLWNVVPYNIDNVRIRYYAQNMAIAYATGLDFRLSGEFIAGDESWFSLGILKTKENLNNDEKGFIPRPSDQLVNLNIFFQDHLPNNPTYKIHLNFFYATGLPFSPPGNPELRNSFRSNPYQRVDIGFSKMIDFKNVKRESSPWIKSLWLGLEILNLTGHQNVISYYWVKDVNNNYYAVPNTLSARFFNIRMTMDF